MYLTLHYLWFLSPFYLSYLTHITYHRIEVKNFPSGAGPPVSKSQFHLSNYVPLRKLLNLFLSVSHLSSLFSLLVSLSPLVSFISKDYCEFQQMWHVINFLSCVSRTCNLFLQSRPSSFLTSVKVATYYLHQSLSTEL